MRHLDVERKMAAFRDNAERERTMRGRAISGKVLDARTGKLCPATTCLRRQGTLDRVIRSRATKPSGEFAFEELALGVYDLFARTEDGKFGTNIGVRLSEEDKARETVVEVSPGATLRIRYEGSTNGGSYLVTAGSLVLAKEDLQRGAEAKEIVPAGPVSVRFSRFNPAKDVERQITALMGDETEVVFGD